MKWARQISRAMPVLVALLVIGAFISFSQQPSTDQTANEAARKLERERTGNPPKQQEQKKESDKRKREEVPKDQQKKSAHPAAAEVASGAGNPGGKGEAIPTADWISLQKQLEIVRSDIEMIRLRLNERTPTYRLWLVTLLVLSVLGLVLLGVLWREMRRFRAAIQATKKAEQLKSAIDMESKDTPEKADMSQTLTETLSSAVVARLLPAISSELEETAARIRFQRPLKTLQMLTGTQVPDLDQLVEKVYHEAKDLQKRLDCASPSDVVTAVELLKEEAAILARIRKQVPAVSDIAGYLCRLNEGMLQAARMVENPSRDLVTLVGQLSRKLSDVESRLAESSKEVTNQRVYWGLVQQRLGGDGNAQQMVNRIGQLVANERALVERAAKETGSSGFATSSAAAESLFTVLEKERRLNRQAREWTETLSTGLVIHGGEKCGPEDRITSFLAEIGEARFPMRLGLVMALSVWERLDLSALEASRSDVLEELGLGGVPNGIRELLDWSPADTEDGIANRIVTGFHQGGWLNRLCRAEAILSTYFSLDASFRELSGAVHLTTTIARVSARLFGVEIRHIPLLGPKPETAEKDLQGAGNLPRIAEVRRLVLAQVEVNRGEPFIVDVTSWGFQRRDGREYRPMVVVCNPMEWQRAEVVAS